MLDYKNERVYPLAEFCRELSAVRGVERGPRTIRDWIKNGCNGLGGERIKLEGITICGSLHTSLEAYDRFVEAQNQGHD